MQQSIRFFYQSAPFAFAHRNRLKQFLARLLRREEQQLQEVRIIFCSDRQLLDINRTHLNHDYYTDIITFPFSEPGEPVEAELYISVDRIRDNAAAAGTSFRRELHRVLFHGLLHLCGYNDKSSQQIKQMREREEHYLRLYFGR
ncbi:MAG TPA: rRNA maturation RNase YbeY [Lacibacter sp.]|nr:rRNA maturation RNase YbeY [Lacibacter sp.]HMO90093.1 rRNA maturation RNase YbeY [Lacibacter sp.]HMP86890.1 rRNA maturation RNase YbeY [Lacibacter sp.]